MAHPDLKALVGGDLIPQQASSAYRGGDEMRAIVHLRRAREGYASGTAESAVLERLEGLLLIAVQREVEGTFALERADALLDSYGLGYPGLEWLETKK
ncbi:hypothetical protein [Deinococcus sp.]|uniref:hypothetical protein n=1 Tax=Deinococcus sp. TaxID=47478 RepID=UPI003CC649D3